MPGRWSSSTARGGGFAEPLIGLDVPKQIVSQSGICRCKGCKEEACSVLRNRMPDQFNGTIVVAISLGRSNVTVA